MKVRKCVNNFVFALSFYSEMSRAAIFRNTLSMQCEFHIS